LNDLGRRTILEFIKSRRLSYAIGCLTLLACSFVASYIPKVLGLITDALRDASADEGDVRALAARMMACVLIVFALKFVWRYMLIGNCRNVECYLRNALFAQMQRLTPKFYDGSRTGDLIAYAINDIQAIRMNFGFGVVAILEGLTTACVSIWFMATAIDPALTLMALAPAPLIVLAMVRLRKSIRSRFTRVQESFAQVSEKVQENVSGIRVIKAYGQERQETEAFEALSADRVKARMSLTRVSAILGPTAQVGFGVSFLLFIVMGGRQVLDGGISLGDYVAFNTYIIVIMAPVMNVSRIIEIWQRGMASFRRIDGLFRSPTARTNEGLGADGHVVGGRVEVRGLTFSYDGEGGRNVLEGVSFEIAPGGTLGIVGKTGSGKTTIANVLMGMYGFGDGMVLFDGVDANKVPKSTVREAVGYVPQDCFLFSASIADNIAFAGDGYSQAEVEEAARLAGIHGDVESFPNGYGTVVGERGMTLSGGQKQRVSIARALIKRPRILLFDDCLSAVDPTTAEAILANLGDSLKGRTGVVISHRISAVMGCDEIIVLDGGRVVERGGHAELMAIEGGLYREISET